MEQSASEPRPPSSVGGHAERITSWPEQRGGFPPASVCYIRNLSIHATIGRVLSPHPAAAFTTVSCCPWARETPQPIFASNSSMMMEYNTPGKYFPSHDTDFPRKSKSCTQVMVEMCCFQPEEKKKKLEQFFSALSNLGWGAQWMCSKSCLLHNQPYFAISFLSVAVLHFECHLTERRHTCFFSCDHTRNLCAIGLCFHVHLRHTPARHCRGNCLRSPASTTEP